MLQDIKAPMIRTLAASAGAVVVLILVANAVIRRPAKPDAKAENGPKITAKAGNLGLSLAVSEGYALSLPSDPELKALWGAVESKDGKGHLNIKFPAASAARIAKGLKDGTASLKVLDAKRGEVAKVKLGSEIPVKLVRQRLWLHVRGEKLDLDLAIFAVSETGSAPKK
jgi:hypothetical protein